MRPLLVVRETYLAQNGNSERTTPSNVARAAGERWTGSSARRSQTTSTVLETQVADIGELAIAFDDAAGVLDVAKSLPCKVMCGGQQ